ncbi:phenylalanine aminomutase (D-beta-phenylalanine forming) [Candidatus Aerophobetes bacterium]|uniref:Phenylalanine aminomutase (D-beta-phenylalanine forming) n=1 Tax=Aerophobetes bacterium TaxID=2030807 RepID=A0A2A4X1F3_UNCAE|nr:MAG: phenylalanine aminomutase (D-beta-phenylalanine forming) [Candidatus Aerophobetes bacterium]
MLKELQQIDEQTGQIFIDGDSLTTSLVSKAAHDVDLKVAIDQKTASQIEASHQTLQQKIREGSIIYGVNTGVGGFVNWLIPENQSGKLQENLIAAVATNVSTYLDDTISRAAILIRLNSLAKGASAISLENFNKLLKIYNAGIAPCIPSKGSLGASGDLGPLACIALVATGKWKAKYKGRIISGKKALANAGIEPMKLGFKEGLSLVNGTSVMTAVAALLVEKAINLIKTYDIISCLTFEALKVKKKPFNPIVHKKKPHRGQLQTAKNIWSLLEDSQMVVSEAAVEKQLQAISTTTPVATNSPIEDAYSIRCTPHIIGPIRDTLKWSQSIITDEINSSNDNPLIIPEENEIFHNGHFHGQYIAMAMDYLSICFTTLSNLSDRRIDRFMDHNHSNGLPPFLCKESPGLRLGLMGGQFMATSITAENRSLCNPVSIQTLPSTGDFQDIVSMGLIAARRAEEIYENTTYILSFELLCAAQAAEMRNAELLSTPTEILFSQVRKMVPYLSKDVCLTNYLEKLAKFLKSGNAVKEVEKTTGKTLEL